MCDSNSNIVLHCHQDKSNMGTSICLSLSPPARAFTDAPNSIFERTESSLHIKLKCSDWNIVRISTAVYVPSLAYRSDATSEGYTVVLSMSGRGCKKSWNAATCLTGPLCLQAKSIALTKWDKIKYTQQNVRISTYEPVNANCCDKEEIIYI